MMHNHAFTGDHARTGERWRLVGRRVAAYLLDCGLFFVVLAPTGQVILRLLDAVPPSGPAISGTILWNFSLPAWLFFILADHSASGATPGKRLFKIRVQTTAGRRLTLGQAFVRTTIKLLPWELVHVFAFALSTDLSQFSQVQIIGIATANVLTVVYLLAAIATCGRRSLHDLAAGTQIDGAQ